jgi:hypothetical protein
MQWTGQKMIMSGRRTKEMSHHGRFMKNATMDESISASVQMVDKTACLAMGM